ncbi:MAG: oligosaccharide flippase family protein [Candidatus Omnitrophota bacterium]
MIRRLINRDPFSKNIILVFFGTSLANVLNLAYQLLIAHRLAPADFAGFNSLLSIFLLISAPASTLQSGVAKFVSGLNAHNEAKKIRLLLSGLLKIALILALVTLFAAYFASFHVLEKLKVNSPLSGYLLILLLSVAWVNPILMGAIQGLEKFGWFTSLTVASSGLKLLLAFIFILLGFNIAGAIGAFLASIIFFMALSFFPLRGNLGLKFTEDNAALFKELGFYLFPLAISTFCFMGLVNMDMVLVRYYFSPDDSGIYSLSQMVGKVFLFFPAAISTVLFPRASNLNARKQDTGPTIKKALAYGFVLCIGAALFYNIFPALVLKVLTGKVYPDSVMLGRLFNLSMGSYAMLFILMTYFLSVKDMRFIKYMVISAVLQFLMIFFFHHSLFQVQYVLCLNSVSLFFMHLWLLFKR